MKKKKIMPTSTLEEDFSHSLFKKLIDELRLYDNFRDIWINFSGGEPFLHPQIFEFLKYARENGARLTIFTNGTLPLSSWQSQLFVFPPHSLMFSIGGSRSEHDQIRGTGNFDKTTEAIRAVRAMKKILGFSRPFIVSNTVINKLNIHCFDEILNLAEELGINTLIFSLIQWSNEKMIQLAKDEFASRFKREDVRVIEGLENSSEELTDEEAETLIRKVNTIKNFRLQSRYREMLFRPDFSSEEEIKKWFSKTCGKVNTCESVYSRIRINYNGDVCLGCSTIFFPLGNIEQQSLKEVLEGERATRFFSEIEKNGYFYACQRCCWRAAESRAT